MKWWLIRLIVLTPLCGILMTMHACRQEPGFSSMSPADSIAIVTRNKLYRDQRQEFFRSDPSSPFLLDSAAVLAELRWFPINPRFRGHSVLHRYANPVAVDIAGTGGEVRKQTRYGYFEFPVPDSAGNPVMIRLNVYKSTHADRFLSVWFTDLTTGIETYGVGRYVDVQPEHVDEDHVYVIDLNMAYNPFCAYSDLYSCAIPSKDDFVPVSLRAGERSFHE